MHQDNPSEELNLVDLKDIGHFYGVPLPGFSGNA